MEITHHKDFLPSLMGLWKRGGLFQKASERAQAAVTRWQAAGKPTDDLPLTNHGETRIKHCIKYDLTGYCRLITWQNDSCLIFLFCGDHQQCEGWLESHKGFQPIVDRRNSFQLTYVSTPEEGQKIDGGAGHSAGLLVDRLPDELFDKLAQGLSRRQSRALDALKSTSTPEELWTAVESVQETDLRVAIYDVFSLLRQDKIREAIERAKLHLGYVEPLDEVPLEMLPEIIDSDVIRRIRADSPAYAEAVKRFIRTQRYRDWMLFMREDQEAIVEEDFEGAAKLVGVSGSGKTCVVVQRAVRLARTYPGCRILVLTINRALAGLISQLVDTCASQEERTRIDVRPFFVLCQELVLEREPSSWKHYDEVTWKHNEHVDEIWQEYYRCEVNNRDAAVLEPIHDSLLARGWNPERYLREEVDWMRSALKPGTREAYFDMTRVGRTVPLPQQFRELVLKGTTGWEEKMAAVGVIDGLGIAHAALRELNGLQPRYRCILVDEAQDFGNIELEIVRHLVADGENDLFLCGDAAQAVTTKYQLFREAGINVPRNRSRKLGLNYRNSRDVLSAAYEVLYKNMTEEMMDREDFEILQPEYSALSGATPLILQGETLQEEISHAIAYTREEINSRHDAKACIAICGFSLLELVKFGTKTGIPVLDGQTDIETGSMFLSDLEQTKGFEFDIMCILHCAAGILPNGSAPDSERFRDLARLYVAMTRARNDLVLSWSGACSPFLVGLEGLFLRATWREYTRGMQVEDHACPEKLETYRRNGRGRKHWREMSGEEFLYSDLALGTSSGLSGKLRELVDGVGMIKGSHKTRIRWRNIGSAFLDHGKSTRLWGSETVQEFVQLVKRLEKEQP